MSIFSERLKLAMKERNITQANLSEITGIPKSAISQYLSDRFSPKRDRTFIICRALNTDPAWIMGLSDVKREFQSTERTLIALDGKEQQLIVFLRANPDLKDELLRMMDSPKRSTTVFRAAKSNFGTVAPKSEVLTAEQIKRLCDAPETDEEL